MINAELSIPEEGYNLSCIWKLTRILNKEDCFIWEKTHEACVWVCGLPEASLKQAPRPSRDPRSQFENRWFTLLLAPGWRRYIESPPFPGNSSYCRKASGFGSMLFCILQPSLKRCRWEKSPDLPQLGRPLWEKVPEICRCWKLLACFLHLPPPPNEINVWGDEKTNQPIGRK